MTLYRVLVGRHSVANVYLDAADEEEAGSSVIQDHLEPDLFEDEHYEILEIVDVESEQDSELGSVVRNTGQSVAEFLAQRLAEAEDE